MSKNIKSMFANYHSFTLLSRCAPHRSQLWYTVGHMFGKLKSFALKKVVESQLKNIPEQYRTMIMEFVENNPELCEKLAGEMKGLQKLSQAEQQSQGMKILMKYQKEITAALTPEMQQALAQFMGAQQGGQFNPMDGTILK